ncbi:hypothetical protein AnigIFM49718_010279, partial [Aspergillus niger]
RISSKGIRSCSCCSSIVGTSYQFLRRWSRRRQRISSKGIRSCSCCSSIVGTSYQFLRRWSRRRWQSNGSSLH